MPLAGPPRRPVGRASALPRRARRLHARLAARRAGPGPRPADRRAARPGASAAASSSRSGPPPRPPVRGRTAGRGRSGVDRRADVPRAWRPARSSAPRSSRRSTPRRRSSSAGLAGRPARGRARPGLALDLLRRTSRSPSLRSSLAWAAAPGLGDAAARRAGSTSSARRLRRRPRGGLVALTLIGRPATPAVPVSSRAAIARAGRRRGRRRRSSRSSERCGSPTRSSTSACSAASRSASAALVSLLTGYAFATAIIGGAVFVDRVLYGGPDEQRLALGALAGATAVGALVSGFAVRVATLPARDPRRARGVDRRRCSRCRAGRRRRRSARPRLALGLFGLGFGLSVTPRSTAAVEAAGRASFGAASSVVTVARMLGMAVGLAVLTAYGSTTIDRLSTRSTRRPTPTCSTSRRTCATGRSRTRSSSRRSSRGRRARPRRSWSGCSSSPAVVTLVGDPAGARARRRGAACGAGRAYAGRRWRSRPRPHPLSRPSRARRSSPIARRRCTDLRRSVPGASASRRRRRRHAPRARGRRGARGICRRARSSPTPWVWVDLAAPSPSPGRGRSARSSASIR